MTVVSEQALFRGLVREWRSRESPSLPFHNPLAAPSLFRETPKEATMNPMEPGSSTGSLLVGEKGEIRGSGRMNTNMGSLEMSAKHNRGRLETSAKGEQGLIGMTQP